MRVTLDMRVNSRVEVGKKSHKSAIRGLKNPVFTRIFRFETRIKPLKAMQVVDFPHIEKNKGRTGSSNLMNALRKVASDVRLRGLPTAQRRERLTMVKTGQIINGETTGLFLDWRQ